MVTGCTESISNPVLTTVFTVILSNIFAAFIGFLFWLRGHKVTVFTQQCLEISIAVHEISKLGSEYWLLPFKAEYNVIGASVEGQESARKGQVLEVRILGLQRQINLSSYDIVGQIPDAERGSFEEAVANLVDAATGGDFQARHGDIDYSKARDIVDNSAMLQMKVAKVRRSALQFFNVFKRDK